MNNSNKNINRFDDTSAFKVQDHQSNNPHHAEDHYIPYQKDYMYPRGMYQKKSNTGLIVAISILSVIVVMITALIILLAANIISFGNRNGEEAPAETSAAENNTQTPSSPVPTAQKPIPVERTMFVGNCNVSVSMRSGADTSFSEIMQIPLGSDIFVIEYENNDFALVTYAGKRGYVKRSYIVSEKPYVAQYNPSDVQNFVYGALVSFVYGVNYGDYDYVYSYYSGAAADEELKSVRTIHDSGVYEEILSLNCHSAARASATTVSVIRDSVIRVTYSDGSVKDISEKYKYTVDVSGSNYKIVGLKNIK